MRTYRRWWWLLSAAVGAGALLVGATVLVGTSRGAARSGPPVNTVAPAVFGPPLAGHVLTAGSGSWSGSGPISFSYQWQRCDTTGATCAPIADASAQTYLLGASDVGGTIRVLVGAQNAAGAASVLSSPTVPIAATPSVGPRCFRAAPSRFLRVACLPPTACW